MAIMPENKVATDVGSFQYRRMPAKVRKISDINPEKDIRVRILGRVIDKRDGVVIIDDGSGSAEVVAEEGFSSVEQNGLVRIFCRVLPLETGYELRAEIIQDMKHLDLDLFRKIHG